MTNHYPLFHNLSPVYSPQKQWKSTTVNGLLDQEVPWLWRYWSPLRLPLTISIAKVLSNQFFGSTTIDISIQLYISLLIGQIHDF